MKSNSMTATLARVARDIEINRDGAIMKGELTELLSEYGVHQEESQYRDKMLNWGWLYIHVDGSYRLTDAGRQTATITITVPRLLSKEVRRHLVEKLAGFQEIIGVGEVEIDD